MEVARQSWAGREVDGARGSTNGGRWRGEKTQQRGGLIEPDGSTHEKRNGDSNTSINSTNNDFCWPETQPLTYIRFTNWCSVDVCKFDTGALSKDGLLKKGETQEWPRYYAIQTGV
uniref:Uncharacterized protein n=1 Tax=Oryza glaberrima TaxID=4538 RepID=I1QMH7_ORYGL